MVFLCCSAGELVKTFELSSEEIALRCTMDSLNAEVTCARYNHNGKILASCSVDGGICLDVASSGELLSRFFAPTKSIGERRINSVFFSSGSRFLASGGHDGCVQVWDLKTQEVTQTYSISASAVTSVTFSGYKDEHIIAGSESGAISVCDVRTADTAGFLAVDPRHGVYKVTAIQNSPHPYARQALGSTYSDGSVRIWDLHTGQLTSEFVRHHDAAATALAISPVSKVLLASGGLDGRVSFFDTVQGAALRSLEFDHPVSALALCADGKTLAVGTTNGEILIYDLRGVITPLYSTRAHDSARVNSLQFATSSAESSVASVFPQGVPVVSSEQQAPASPLSSPQRHGETLQDIALRKLQSLGIGSALAASPPPSPTHTDSRYNPLVCQSEVSSHHQHQQSGGSVQIKHQSTLPDQSPVSPHAVRPASPEPSLLSQLAISGSALAPPRAPEQPTDAAATSLQSTLSPRDRSDADVSVACDRENHNIRERIQFVRHELEVQHRTTFDQVSTVLEELLYSYECLVTENARLRAENGQLAAHIKRSSE